MPNADGRQSDVRASAKGVRWHAACPFPAAALLCHFGPLLHFKKSASGCCRPPPPAVGRLAADLSYYTRRDFSRRWPGRSRRFRVRIGHVRTVPGPPSHGRCVGRPRRSARPVSGCDASGTQGSGIPAGIGADSGKFRLWTGIPGIRDCRRVLGSGGTPGVHTGTKIDPTCTGISILGSFSRMSR